MNGIVYSGSYTCEGHTVHFVINDDDTVDITEVTEMTNAPIGKTYTSTKKAPCERSRAPKIPPRTRYPNFRQPPTNDAYKEQI